MHSRDRLATVVGAACKEFLMSRDSAHQEMTFADIVNASAREGRVRKKREKAKRQSLVEEAAEDIEGSWEY